MDLTSKLKFILMVLYVLVQQSGFISGKHIPTTTAKEESIGNSKMDVGSVDISKTYSGATDFMGLNAAVQQALVKVVNKPEQVTSNISTDGSNTVRYKEPWELNLNLCPPSLCFANEEQRPKGAGGSVFYNGDIVLDKESAKIIYSNMTSMRYKRATARNPRTWRNAVVPYKFASDIAPLSAAAISKAMRTIERETCIRFRKRRLRDEDYIRFISEPGCWSAVGRVGGEQKVSIGPECERLGIVIHEILHALGFWHEQARPDRDKYVQIIEENIEPKYIPDFKQTNKMLVTSRGFPYDYQSIMHYGNKAFTRHGKDTIRVIGIGRKLKMRIGQRVALSNIDIAQLRDMYKCFSKETSKTCCPKGWIKIGRKCYTFEYKQLDDFAGAVVKCEKMASKLVSPIDATEQFNIKEYIKRVYPNIKVWRTGERIKNGSFVWYSGEVGGKVMYTNWNDSHPATYSSFARLYSTRKRRSHRGGVWIDSSHACPFICELRAKYRCVPAKFSDGRDYRGTLDHTVDGYTCQKWSSQYPWSHSLLAFPYSGTGNKQDGLGDHNFCRNPSGDRKSRPWCYTTKSKYKWQYCDVSVCSKKENSGVSSDPNIYDKNIATGKTTYKTFPKSIKAFKRGRDGKEISKITLRKHNPQTNTARKVRKPSFSKKKKSNRKKYSRKMRKSNILRKPNIDRKMSKRRSGKSRTKSSLKRSKYKKTKT